MSCQVVDGAGTDQVVVRARDHEHAFGMDRHGGIVSGEGAGIAEMHGGIPAVEQPGLGQEKDAGAGRAQFGAALVHAPQPVDQARVAALLPAGRLQQHRRHDHDVARGDIVDGPLHLDGQPAGEQQRARPVADDVDHERGLRARAGKPHQRGPVHHVVDAGQRRDRCVGQGDEGDPQGFWSAVVCLSGHRASRITGWARHGGSAVARMNRSRAIAALSRILARRHDHRQLSNNASARKEQPCWTDQ